MAGVTEIRFEVPGPGVPKAMKAFALHGIGHMRNTPKTKKYQKRVAAVAELVAPPTPWTGPIELRILIERAPLAAHKKSKSLLARVLRGLVYPITTPDNSNVAKAVEDGMTGIIYIDDAQICRLLVVKRYAERARVVVNVIRMQTEEPEQISGPFAEMS